MEIASSAQSRNLKGVFSLLGVSDPSNTPVLNKTGYNGSCLGVVGWTRSQSDGFLARSGGNPSCRQEFASVLRRDHLPRRD